MMILNVMDENKGIYCFDEILDAKYGKVGTASRERFRKEAEAYCVVDYPEVASNDRMFENLAGCWKDCLEMDGVEQVIRESRTSGVTRRIVGFTDREGSN